MPTTVRFPPELAAWITRQAKKTPGGKAAVIREACDRLRQAKEGLHSSLLDAVGAE